MAGRPPRRRVANSALVRVRCLKTERALWYKLARKKGLTLSDLIRDMLNKMSKVKKEAR